MRVDDMHLHRPLAQELDETRREALEDRDHSRAATDQNHA